MSDSHAPNVRAYMMIFGTLLFLTVLTVLVSYWHLPILWAVAAALAIATLKAGLVATFFMHLKSERVLIYGLLGLTAFFVVFLFAVPSVDTQALVGVSARAPVAAQAGK